MAWITYADTRGRGWAFDPDGCAHVFRSCFYNRELVSRSRIRRVDHGWGLPTTTEVETNFNGIRAATTAAARVSINEILADAARDARGFYEHLVRVRADGEAASAHYNRMSREASHATAQAIDANVGGWENALAAARFVRDASAGVLLVGATVLSGGTALAVGAGGTGLTFTGNTQDNLAANQTLRQAMGNAAITTSITVVTNVLIPRGLSAAGRSMVGPTLTTGQNIALGLLTVQANIAGDIAKTALVADQNIGPAARHQAQQQLQRQVGARAATEVASMLFGAWLQSRGLPASVTVELRESVGQMRDSVSGALLGAIGDRVVAAMSQQDQRLVAGPGSDLDLAFAQLRRTVDAEAFVREMAMRPL